MSEPKDTQSGSETGKPAEARNEPTAVGDQGGDRRSGRVAYDSRGNPTWEWQLETGVYTRDVSTQRLKKLDLGELSLADTAIHKQPGVADTPSPQPGGGFNPYDKGASNTGSNPYDNARASNRTSGQTSSPPAPARKPSDLRKLDEWVKLTKKVQNSKEED